MDQLVTSVARGFFEQACIFGPDCLTPRLASHSLRISS